MGRLIDRATSLADLRLHRLHLLAAARWRAAGLAVPPRLVREEAKFAILTSAADTVLKAIRDTCDGPLLLLKGPAVSRLYPDPSWRPFTDLDVLAEDPERTQRALVAAGFRPYAGLPDEYYHGRQHLRPLLLEGLPGPFVEIHRRPHWVSFADAPSASELFSVATEEASGVEGYVALPPAHHALVIAAHSWAHRPLRRILDLVDVELLAAAGSRQEVARVASRWNLSRLWRVTADVADALIMGGGQASSGASSMGSQSCRGARHHGLRKSRSAISLALLRAPVGARLGGVCDGPFGRGAAGPGRTLEAQALPNARGTGPPHPSGLGAGANARP